MSKRIELDVLKQEAFACQKCPDLVANRSQVVFADGNPNAPLMIVGEAPGANEDRKGLPFVGDAGELLDNILKACKWTRNDVYITNTVLCRPPNNRDPEDNERYNCRSYLDGQIDKVQPKYLLLLGSIASKNLLGGTVSALRGVWQEYKGIPTLCTWHPARAIREGDSVKKEMGQDFRMLIKKMKEAE